MKYTSYSNGSQVLYQNGLVIDAKSTNPIYAGDRFGQKRSVAKSGKVLWPASQKTYIKAIHGKLN